MSELRMSERRADRSVREWVSARRPSDLCLSVTILEVELGITRLGRRDTAQAERLQRWFEGDLLEVFAGRTLASRLITRSGARRP
ncbi:type II toxin-antitoxin system VapC family toxin [Janibacter anophelis]|uniref:type II toxin-antitoxin system VapC family toxin n=1 Tax=Janibacter anophelis TaxID=319054 RepID=UPI0013B06B3B|nr:type II toxin-antitoxin system VapC family toxin [Janibacter anophelis]